MKTMMNQPGENPVPDLWRRDYQINMPQMALSGLSEPWLFKEIGDIHWGMLSDYLRTPSSRIKDAEGNRLYATFARIVLNIEDDLRDFPENSRLDVESTLERYGAAYFFGEHEGEAGGGRFTARTMSTFAKFGQRGENNKLVKGEPELPSPDSLPSLKVFPDIGTEYRAGRVRETKEILETCEYEILPMHDINGVGLLYFAAYPSIFDLCLERIEGKGFLIGHSTSFKDVRYMGNADPTETLTFQLHAREVSGDLIHHHGSIWRKSDNRRIGEINSTKRRL